MCVFVVWTRTLCLLFTVLIWNFMRNASERGLHALGLGFGVPLGETLETYLSHIVIKCNSYKNIINRCTQFYQMFVSLYHFPLLPCIRLLSAHMSSWLGTSKTGNCLQHISRRKVSYCFHIVCQTKYARSSRHVALLEQLTDLRRGSKLLTVDSQFVPYTHVWNGKFLL